MLRIVSVFWVFVLTGCTALHPFYEAQYGDLIWSPNGRFAVTNTWEARSQIVIDIILNRTYSVSDNRRVSGGRWTADSRYVILSAYNQYNNNALFVFDTHEWRLVAKVGGCDSFLMSPCEAGELRLDETPPRIVFRGTTLSLTPDGIYFETSP
jgi:hypothetical protein